jgi:alpha-beta hydrolase superfamily lysophospholipase
LLGKNGNVKQSVSWKPDVLGEGYLQATLELTPDSEGEVVATLVKGPEPVASSFFKRLAGKSTQVAQFTDVLYIHGWSDYFFQKNLAEYWRSQGAQFYALDLRKYGRSIRPGQSEGFTDNLADYDEDIEAALEVMGHGTTKSGSHESVLEGRKLVVMGHSTGGLVFSLWADRNPGRANAVVLNSPWLEYQLTAAARAVVAPVMRAGTRLNPKAQMPSIDFGFYSRAVDIHKDGEWEFNYDWRPEHGFPVRPAWLNAILAGHAKVAAGLNITEPVFTWLSTKSMLVPRWHEEMMTSDVAIDVNIVAARVHQLGKLITLARIENAMHDVVLSEKPARTHAFNELTQWLKAYL